MRQLHARGLLHGDLYAHNILWNEDSGECLLGDFGAAWSTGALDAAQEQALQALDVRAFGCLLEELLEDRCTDGAAAANAPAMRALAALQARCLQPVAAARPAFSALLTALQGIERSAAP
jgi:serine/threonine protein kinase